jgi:Cof subfamily protein (haloacid dehalogenase superfamily)
MIATDIDQTFLDNQNQYNQQRFQEIFAEIQRQKIHFVAASGSQHERLQAVFPDFVDQMDFVSQNGSIIYSGNELLDVQQLAMPLLQKTLDAINATFAPEEILINICGLASSYVDTTTPNEVVDFLRQFYKELQTVDHINQFDQTGIDDPIVKIALGFGDASDVDLKIAKLREILDPSLSSLSSGFNTELIGFGNVDKSSALQRLMDTYHVQPNELIAFGDNENDLKMLQMTPNGYAMQNAFPAVKAAANHVTRYDNEHDGVLDTLEQLL